MANRISNYIPSTPSRPQKIADAKRRQKQEDSGLKQYSAPHKAQFNYIPPDDVLKNMIDRALEALSRGVYWDRGSIINLLL